MSEQEITVKRMWENFLKKGFNNIKLSEKRTMLLKLAFYVGYLEAFGSLIDLPIDYEIEEANKIMHRIHKEAIDELDVIAKGTDELNE